jgi:hypothetical protein
LRAIALIKDVPYYFALKKLWLYLFLGSFVSMMVLVFLGNPKLPILPIAGLSWHHIPEILMFFFLGVWLGDFKFLSTMDLCLYDACLLLVLALPTLNGLIGHPSEIFAVITLATFPSFFGYFLKRYFTIR